MRDLLVALDLAVADMDHATGVIGDVRLVGNDDNRMSSPMELLKDRHELDPRGVVEIAGRLIGQQNARIICQRPGNRDPLLFSAG